MGSATCGTDSMMAIPSHLLCAYDGQLRGESEALGALTVSRHGPLWLMTLSGGRGLISYRDLGGAGAAEVRELVTVALRHFRAIGSVQQVEWKTRGHDLAPGLHDALIDNAFVAQEVESIMIGEAGLLVADVALPRDVTLRRITSEGDVVRMCTLQAEVFGDSDPGPQIKSILGRLADEDGTELWIAEAGTEVISAGRLEPVPNTDFAGIWGGATRPEWRRKGIYRALTAARARAALSLGKTLIHSDSTAHSRPILEMSGLTRVSTTTPYLWTPTC